MRARERGETNAAEVRAHNEEVKSEAHEKARRKTTRMDKRESEQKEQEEVAVERDRRNERN